MAPSKIKPGCFDCPLPFQKPSATKSLRVRAWVLVFSFSLFIFQEGHTGQQVTHRKSAVSTSATRQLLGLKLLTTELTEGDYGADEAGQEKSLNDFLFGTTRNLRCASEGKYLEIQDPSEKNHKTQLDGTSERLKLLDFELKSSYFLHRKVAL